MNRPFKTGDMVIDNLSNDKQTAKILSIDTIAQKVRIKFDTGGYGERKFYEISEPDMQPSTDNVLKKIN
jgi:hypothetical protein